MVHTEYKINYITKIIEKEILERNQNIDKNLKTKRLKQLEKEIEEESEALEKEIERQETKQELDYKLQGKVLQIKEIEEINKLENKLKNICSSNLSNYFNTGKGHEMMIQECSKCLKKYNLKQELINFYNQTNQTNQTEIRKRIANVIYIIDPDDEHFKKRPMQAVQAQEGGRTSTKPRKSSRRRVRRTRRRI